MEKNLTLEKLPNKLQEIDELKEWAQKLLKEGGLPGGMGRVLRRHLKEIALQQNHFQGMKDWKKKKEFADLDKIQIGGGSHSLKGYFNVDITPPADLIWDVRERLPFPDACCGSIFSEHFLEHIDYPISVKRFIRECFRILKSGGRVVIGVPDGGLAAKKYASEDQRFFRQMLKRWYSKRNCLVHFNTKIDFLNYVFRDQDDDKKYNPHFWAYDFEKLNSLLREAGFLRINRWRFDSSIANPKRKWGSLYVTAVK